MNTFAHFKAIATGALIFGASTMALAGPVSVHKPLTKAQEQKVLSHKICQVPKDLQQQIVKLKKQRQVKAHKVYAHMCNNAKHILFKLIDKTKKLDAALNQPKINKKHVMHLTKQVNRLRSKLLRNQVHTRIKLKEIGNLNLPFHL